MKSWKDVQQKTLDYLLNDPSKMKLQVFDLLFSKMIPFNRPHGFQAKTITSEKVVVQIPFKQNNMNHLKGIHACAIATLGEIAGGLLLLKNFGMERYRLILKELQVSYVFQAKTALKGESVMTSSEREELIKNLKNDGVSLCERLTVITDLGNNKVAEVKTLWQLKDWKKVQTHSN